MEILGIGGNPVFFFFVCDLFCKPRRVRRGASLEKRLAGNRTCPANSRHDGSGHLFCVLFRVFSLFYKTIRFACRQFETFLVNHSAIKAYMNHLLPMQSNLPRESCWLIRSCDANFGEKREDLKFILSE